MRLFLARHGETEENRKGIIQSYMEGTLSERGKEQSKKLSSRLSMEHLDVIYSSDAKRAIDTAEYVWDFHSQCPLILSRELREADFGKYAGRSKRGLDFRNLEGIESQEQLQQRAEKFYRSLLQDCLYSNVLVISHAGLIKSLMSVIEGISSEKIWDMPTPENTALSLFNITQDATELIYQNCLYHLAEK